MRPRIALLALAVAVGTVALIGCAPSLATKYDLAKNLQNEKKFDDAIEEYDLYIQENSKSTLVPYALYNIAWCHRGMYEKAEALAAYQRVIDQYPGTDPAGWAKVEMDRLKAMELTPPAKGSGAK